MDVNGGEKILHKLPAVNEILQSSQISELLSFYPREIVLEIIRSALDRIRDELKNNEGSGRSFSREQLKGLVVLETAETVKRIAGSNVKKVINGTGVILHTNLGRSLLSTAACQAVFLAASSYINLEFDLDTGRRGSRHAAVQDILFRLTGAESFLAVNNNAAAVLLALSTLARGKEVIVSRGQLVEIGGSFRIPEIMKQSGCTLVEVGTTNKTYVEDYRAAITERTALILHVHTSNYHIIGFTRQASVSELVKLGREFNLPVMSDLGSGVLADLGFFNLPAEPTVQQVLGAGISVVTFSGDKMLGGPQAGIVAGKKEIIEEMHKNPLARALRIDKLTLAALEATLRSYLNPEQALEDIPTLRMITGDLEDIRLRAEDMACSLREAVQREAEITVRSSVSRVGGGAMPTAELPSFAVAVKPFKLSMERFSQLLRYHEPAVLGRVREDLFLLDLRTIQNGEEKMILDALSGVLLKEEKKELFQG
ncbi:MAG: L-seryl-tRNA(Sec) selenium transferase [Eubacteriales bacterium]